jgi:tetratricopeptide (TPR) repeat protein
VNKQQLILVVTSIVLLPVLFFFGRTVPPQKNTPNSSTSTGQHSANDAHDHSLSFDIMLPSFKEKLSPSQQTYITALEAAVVRGDVKEQQIKVYNQLAAFWKDSARAFVPYAWYMAASAKLENSEKNLTFAARLFLDDLRGQQNTALKSWEANQAKQLFEKALLLNAANDSSKIGLGSCYIFGSTAENPQEVMQGIQKILEVSRKDSTNMYAQLMLGIGGITSGQYDKAVERFIKVVKAEPGNLEAVLMLAEAYERKGDKENAATWYSEAKKQIPDAGVQKEIQDRIDLLKK